MNRKLKEIASLISGEISGNADTVIKNAAEPENSQTGDITFAVDEKALAMFERSKASAAIIPRTLNKFPSKPHIKVNDVRFAMAKTLALFDRRKPPSKGIRKSAIVSKTAKIGSGCSIMDNVFIGDGVSIGDKAIIYPGCYIGENCKIGHKTTLFPNVVLYEDTIVGDRCILHGGVILGTDGFGFAPIDGKYEKIPQIGNVVIEDDVEIGANSCVSRATMGSTVIKRGTKIDNLVHIAHNCKIGEDCAITALVAVAGSSELKDHVSIAGMAGVVDHVTIGENTVVMAKAGVTKDMPANSVISGFPAQDHQKELEQLAAVKRLPAVIKRISEIENLLKKQ
jgi:UDP-3-O-[3-hydroxymyristoyl] glucosamine N-acyltransferase